MPSRLFATVVLAGLLGSPGGAGDAEDLQSPDAKTRLQAARRLGKFQAKIEPALVPLLVERLREDPDPQVRFALAHALSNLPQPDKLALAALVEVAQDENEALATRLSAMGTLGKLGKGSKRVANVLVKLADDPAMTRSAIQVLVTLGSEDRAKPFLDHKNPKVRAAAVDAYASSGGTDVLAVSLGSSDQALRRKAAEGIENRDYYRYPLKSDEIATLVKFAGDPDVKVRVSITQGMTKGKQTSRIISTLVEGIESVDESVRWTSAEGLAVAGPGIAPHLAKIVAVIEKTPPSRMKSALLRAIGEAEADAKPGLPTLYAALKAKDDDTRASAVKALLKGAAADPAEAVKQVRALTNDQYADARENAHKVIATWAKLDTADVATMLRERDLGTALKALPLVHKLGPDAKPLLPDLLALAARIPPPRPNVAGGSEIGDIGGAISAVGPGAVPGIVEGLKSPNEQVRKPSASALEKLRIDAAEALPSLRQGVLDANAGVRIMSAHALGSLGYRARTAILELILSLTKFPDTSGQMAEAICWIGAAGDEAKKLLAMAREPAATPAARACRVFALGGAGKEAIPLLEEIQKGLGPNDPLRRIIAEAKWHADREEVARIQINGLKDQKDAKAPHDAALTALKYELNAKQRKELVAGLVVMLETRPAPIQIEALRCLAWVSPESAEALPAVEKLFTSPDEAVRRIAKLTANRIRK